MKTENNESGQVAQSAFVGELVSTKSAILKAFFGMVALAALALSGCGGGSSTGNVVTISVTPKGTTSAPASVIITQSATFTATVSGTTNTNVTWACTWATETFDSSGNPKDGTATACNSTTGTIPANSANTTVVFSAPETLPDPRKISGTNCTDTTKSCFLFITLTATAAADTKKTDTTVLLILSGITVTLNPATATVPTSAQFPFSATVTNDIGTTKGVTWLVTQGTIDLTKGINFPQLPTCSPACGSIDTNGIYTAPSAVPTTPTVTLVATSNADPNCIGSSSCFAVGTITIVTAGDIKFNGISPVVMPQGAAVYDLYIFAPGVTSASQVIITPSQGVAKSYNFGNPQLKILFPIPTTTVTNPTSSGVRIRLQAADLAASDTYTVSVTDPNHPPTLGPGPFKFSVIPVRASTVSSQPDSYVQDTQSQQFNVLVNGGYFGPPPNFVKSTFLGNPGIADVPTSSSRQLNLNFTASSANSAQPGLYELSVFRSLAPLPADNSPSVTNFSLFPDYQKNPLGSGPFPSVPDGAAAQPSAIDIDQLTGIAAVASTGLNRVDFFQIGSGTITSIGSTSTVNVPTSVSINQRLHQVSVVSFKDQSVSVFQMPTVPNGSVTSPLQPITSISLAGLVPPRSDTTTQKYLPPFAYSIGVDSDTNHAVVAYSSSSNPTTALVGFLLDLNTGASDCIATAQQTQTTNSPCISGQVSMATGLYPQVAMLPHTHSAVVTPGGLGSTTGIDVLHSSTSVGIQSVALTSGLVTVVTSKDHGLNPLTPGTVLINGVSPGKTNQINFNGPFVVQSVVNSTTFTYALAQTVNDTSSGGNVFYGVPNLSVGGLSQTTQAIAVNPITGLVAAADPNATGTTTGPQVNLLSSLDQSVSSITFRTGSAIVNGQNTFFGCTFYTTSCAGGPELLGTTGVAFQPFANLLVSYNGPQNQLSVSDPVTQQRYAWTQLTPGPSPVQTSTVPMATTGFSADLTLTGGLAVDAASNQAVVVNSSNGTITLVSLGAIKPVHVTEVVVPSAAPNDPFTQGGIPGANFPQGTITSTTDLVGVKIFGSGFLSGGATVRLDATPITTPAPVSDREIDVTIPASFLAGPHHYALDVVSGGVTSNASDFFVVKPIDLSGVCKDANGNSITSPASVAIADQLGLGNYSPIAVVANSGCNNVAVLDIAPQLPTFDNTGKFTGFTPNANFGTILHTVTVGSGPSGVAISPRFAVAIVANNGAGTASIVDLTANNLKVADVTTGTGPIGVAINEGTGAALVANTDSNTVSEINIGLLFPTDGSTPPTTLSATSIGVDTAPIAIAIDPDRGTNNNGLAVVTALALTSSFPRGVLDAVDIGSTTPAKSTTAVAGSTTLTPTGVVFDPSVTPTLFYAVSSGGNLVTSYNPDNGGQASSVRVGINPTSLALNPQTGGIITVNNLTNTISIVDTLSSPFKTQHSYGLPGPPPANVTINQLQTNQVAIDQFLNMAVIVDQAHNRVLLFPMPN